MSSISIDALGSVFAQALIEIISKVAGFCLDVISEERDEEFDEYLALMSLNSVKGGVIFISAGKKSMRSLCSFMEGVPEDDVSKEDIEDVLCELVNMTAGNAKLLLKDTEYTYSLSSPFIIRGRDLSLTAKKRAIVISKTLGNGDISVKLKVVY